MNNRNFSIFTLFLAVFGLFINTSVFAGSHDEHGGHGEEKPFDAVETIMHHIKDSHDWHLWGHTSIPLPVILYSQEAGFDVFMSSEFKHDDLGEVLVKDKYLKYHGHIYLADANGKLDLGGHKELGNDLAEKADLNVVEDSSRETSEDASHGYPVNNKPLDFSITRNVAAMFLSIIILLLVFGGVARSYDSNGVARGIGAFLEPLVIFVRDEIAIPNIGEKKYAKYLPYLLTAFFFIWINNLLGLIPFFPGGSNLTGNISLTMVLALFTFIITQISGTKDYWGHIFWMPGVPVAMRPLLAVVEFIGLFTKPFALMMRLFANITAGHILILALISLIFILKTAWMSLASIPFVIFMSCLELLVAALQAYIFTLLSALFIGMAVEEHDHGHEHAH